MQQNPVILISCILPYQNLAPKLFAMQLECRQFARTLGCIMLVAADVAQRCWLGAEMMRSGKLTFF